MPPPNRWRICQSIYDAQLPPEVSEASLELEWLEHSAEQLVCGMNIKWKRRFGQAIRNHIRNGAVPGEQIGKLWYVDWTAFTRSDGNDLVAMVLKGAA